MSSDLSYSLDYDPVSRTVIVRGQRVFDAQFILDAYLDAVARFEVTQTNFLWDLAGASFSDFSVEEIEKVKQERVKHSSLRTHTKSCALVDTQMKIWLMELYRVIHSGVSPDTKIFTSAAEARAYLGLSDDIVLSLDY